MMENYYKLIITTLIICLLCTFTFSNFVWANNDIQVFENPDTNEKAYVKIICDNEEFKKVESWNDAIKSIITLNKKTEEISIVTKCIKTGEIHNSKYTVNNNFISNNDMFTLASTTSHIDSGSAGQNKYKYRHDTRNKNWTITIPKEKSTSLQTKKLKENPNNTDDLIDFRKSVNNMKKTELKLTAEFGGGYLTTAIALVITPEPWTTIIGLLTILGVGILVIPSFYDLWSHAKDARMYYHRAR